MYLTARSNAKRSTLPIVVSLSLAIREWSKCFPSRTLVRYFPSLPALVLDISPTVTLTQLWEIDVGDIPRNLAFEGNNNAQIIIHTLYNSEL